MDSLLSRNWWAFALRGVLAIIAGVLAILVPGPALAALILVFGAYSIVDGAFAVAAGMGASGGPRWLMILGGAAGLVIGAFAFSQPGLTALALLSLIAFWAIATGVFEILAAIRLREVIDREWVLVLNGAISVVFGAFLLISPGAGALAVIWLIGWYAIVAGAMYLAVAWRLRGHGSRSSTGFGSGVLSGR